MAAFRQLGLGARLGLGTSLLVGGVCIAQSWLLGPRAVANLAQSLRDVGHATSSELARAAGPSLVAADLAGLRLLAEQARARTDIAYCRFYDARGLLLSSTGPVGAAAATPLAPTGSDARDPIAVGTDFWEFRAPVLVEAAPTGPATALVEHPRPPERAGTVAVGVSRASLHALRRQTIVTALLVTSLFASLGIVAAGLLARAITHPLRALAFAARAISRGDFTAQVPIGATGEVGDLATAFDTMAQSLAESRSVLEEKLEQLERANHLKSEFLATVSHELRTPLNVILGHAEMLLGGAGGPLTPEQADMLATIDRYSKLQLELITNVLDFSRLASGQISFHVERFMIGPLLDDVLALHRGRLRERRIALSVSVHAALPPLETDRVKLQEILQNLVDNAAKFTPSGAVTVTAGPGSEPGWVCLAVSDTGPGIAPEDVPLIFDPFHQIGASCTRGTGGAGLGLSIVRQLTGALGGRVSVRSRVGHGSTFQVDIPVRLPGMTDALPERTAVEALDAVKQNRRRLAAAPPRVARTGYRRGR